MKIVGSVPIARTCQGTEDQERKRSHVIKRNVYSKHKTFFGLYSLYMYYLYSITQGSDVIKRTQDNGSNNTAHIDKVCAPVLDVYY